MVLVSILGDFHSSILPIFYEFKDKLTYHIILHDDSIHDKKQTEKLINAQLDYILLNEEEIKYKILNLTVKEDDYSSIKNAYEIIVSKAEKPKHIYLNSTDGLSSVSIVLANKLLSHGSNVVAYDKFANTYNLHTENNMKKKHIDNVLDIKDHLKLKGYKLLSYTNKFALKNRREAIYLLTKNLKKYKKFANKYPYNQDSVFYALIENINLKDINKNTFVKGTVFEEYIYWLIKDNLEVDDIMTSVSIEFEENFRNEIDILIMKDNHLHSIECKFVRKLDGEHFVYKTDSIKDYLDDDGKAMILSIGSEEKEFNPRKNKYTPQFTLGDLGRAKNTQIKIHQREELDIKKFLDDVKDFFSLEYKRNSIFA